MNLREKAIEVNLSERMLQDRCKKQPGYLGSVKVGKEYVFPDSTPSYSEDVDLDIIPSPDTAKELSDYFQCLTRRETFLKSRQERLIEASKLVRREDLEKSYKESATQVKTEVEKLPDALKHRVEISAKAHAVLEQLCDQLLERLADNGKRKRTK